MKIKKSFTVFSCAILFALALLFVQNHALADFASDPELVDTSDALGEYPSIGVDGSDIPYIAYWDDTNDYLKFASKATGSWVDTTVDDTGLGDCGKYSSMAVDSSDAFHIVYKCGTQTVKYATCSGSCSATGDWDKIIIEDGTTNDSAYPTVAVD